MRDRLAFVSRVAATVICALFVATVVRGTTIELNQSIGRVWPFSLARCAAPDTPGCSLEERSAMSGAGQHRVRVGTTAWWSLPAA